MYTFCSSVLLVYTGWGFLKCLWSSVSINADYILQFDARRCDKGPAILSRGAHLFSMFNLNLLLYYKLRRGVAGYLNNVPAYLLPVLQLLVTFYALLFPLRKRRGLIEGVWETVKTPWGRVGFRENIIGDFATSAVKVNTGERERERERGLEYTPAMCCVCARQDFSCEEPLVFFHLNHK